MLRCNTDGVSKGNLRESAYGKIFRNWEGNVLFAQAEQLGLATNIEAEARAIQMALRLSIEKKWTDIILETDSNSLVHIIKGTWKSLWELSEVIEEITINMQKQQATIQHIFREGNQLADYLANIAFNQTGKQQSHSFKELPSAVRRIINSDKSQLPYIRVKTKQITHTRS